METMKLTLAEFRATGRDVADLDDAPHHLGVEGAGRVYLYDGGLFIERTDEGAFCLTIGNWSAVAPLPELERELYAWAVDEQIIEGDADEAAADRAEAIADEFAKGLRHALTPDEFEEMRRRNVQHTDDGICSSHDFCDANLVMDAAFELVTGTSITAIENAGGGMSQTDVGKWNRAWEIAKARHLTAAVKAKGGAK